MLDHSSFGSHRSFQPPGFFGRLEGAYDGSNRDRGYRNDVLSQPSHDPSSSFARAASRRLGFHSRSIVDGSQRPDFDFLLGR